MSHCALRSPTATPQTWSYRANTQKVNAAFERGGWGKLQPIPTSHQREIPFTQRYGCRDHLVQHFTLKTRNLTRKRNIYVPGFIFSQATCLGIAVCFFNKWKGKDVRSFKSISLGNLAKHFMGTWTAPRILPVLKFTYVHHCQRAEKTCQIKGNVQLRKWNIKCTPHCP